MVKIGGDGKGFGIEETEEQKREWKRLASKFLKNGGTGLEIDLSVEVVSIENPYQLREWNPVAKTFEDKGDPDEGCNITVRVLDKVGNGVLLAKEGTYSGHPRASLGKLIVACTRNQVEDGEDYDEQECVGQQVIATVKMGKKREKGDYQGGYYWNITGFKPVLVDEEEEEEAPPPPKKAAAPLKKNTAAATTRRAPAPIDDDDLDDVPF